MWANKKVFDDLGIAQPTTWDELVAALDKIKAAGLVAVAHGGQPWQEATIFDAVVMSTGGPDFYKKAFIDLTPGEWNEMMDVNVNAIYHATHAVLPGMIARGAGHIVNVSSIAGRSIMLGGSGYNATKHAVQALSECLMLEVRDYGVKVSLVMPGSVATELTPGAGVVTTRGHVHWIVTEYGAVDLHGRSLRERGEALVSIAHPDFRAELRRSLASVRHYILG